MAAQLKCGEVVIGPDEVAIMNRMTLVVCFEMYCLLISG